MSKALVSVVIPTYGRPDSVVGAVETVREQTYEPIELVVVDDCSSDPIEPRVRDMDLDRFAAVHVRRHDENRGAPAARATGMEVGNGDFIAFLDDDDRWVAEKLANQVAALREAGPEAVVAYTGMRIVDGDSGTVRTHKPAASGDLTKTLLCRNVVGSYSTVLVRREAVDAVGSPDERFPAWQDLEWYVRLSQHGEFVVVSEPMAINTQAGAHNQLSDDFEAIATEAYPLFLKKFRPLAAEYGSLFERKMLGWAAFRVGGYNALRTGHYGAARQFLLRAVLTYPLEPTFWLYLAVSLTGRPGHRFATAVKRRLFD